VKPAAWGCRYTAMRHPSVAIAHGQARSTSVPVTVGRTVNGLRCVCFARNFAVEGKERERGFLAVSASCVLFGCRGHLPTPLANVHSLLHWLSFRCTSHAVYACG
jgi:hypothetical protein